MPATMITESPRPRRRLTRWQETRLRFGIGEKELQDPRIRALLETKIELDEQVRAQKNVPYSDKRVAGVCKEFNLTQGDISERRIASLVKAVIDSRIFLEVLRTGDKEQQ